MSREAKKRFCLGSCRICSSRWVGGGGTEGERGEVLLHSVLGGAVMAGWGEL